MQLLSSQVQNYIAHSSLIRQMFEAGIRLKKQYGAENVYDFSLGNPDLPPPDGVEKALLKLAKKAGESFAFGYMPNAGNSTVRKVLAEKLSREQQMSVSAEHLLLTVGAAGGMNAFFRAILEVGDEVLCPAPYFVEYGFYVENFGGKLCPVPSQPDSFDLDLQAIEAAITPATRVVLINSPNNPTGKIYNREQLAELAKILKRKNAGRLRPIYLLADEPYRFLCFEGEVPALFPLYPYTVICSSFSKSLSLAGERIGYLLLQPQMPKVEELFAGLVLTNRILGFVNAPCIGQYIVENCLYEQADIAVYARRRQKMAAVLDAAGLEYFLPQGAFYFFPKTPKGVSDKDFVNLLQAERVLAVAGSGFGLEGHFRLSFAVSEEVIAGSRDGFLRAVQRAGV